METKVTLKVDGVGSGSAAQLVSGFLHSVRYIYAIMPELEIVAEYERYKDVADAYNVDLASVGLQLQLLSKQKSAAAMAADCIQPN